MPKDPSFGHSLCETIKFLAKLKERIFQPTISFFKNMNMFCHYFSHNAKHLRASPISGDAQSCVTRQKYFSHPSLVIYTFCDPAHKTRTQTANRWDSTGLLIANHLHGQLRNREEQVRTYLLHSSLAGTQLSCAVLGQNQHSLQSQPNPHGLTFLYSILMCRVTC
jgi:hypothetical protein